jgi:hypothetical protein
VTKKQGELSARESLFTPHQPTIGLKRDNPRPVPAEVFGGDSGPPYWRLFVAVEKIAPLN